MKLHEAIRLGAMNRRQGFGSFLSSGWRTCAIGAALDAMNLLVLDSQDWEEDAMGAGTNMATAVREWPILDKLVVNPMHEPRPHQHPYLQPLRMVIVELNDVHEWTRERIAMWVERIEHEDARVRNEAECKHDKADARVRNEAECKHDKAHVS